MFYFDTEIKNVTFNYSMKSLQLLKIMNSILNINQLGQGLYLKAGAKKKKE